MSIHNNIISPVKPREYCVSGIHCERPPPAEEPLTPIVGPPDGCRIAAEDHFPRFARPWTNPIVVVDFPSPKGVGVITVTSIYFPSEHCSSLESTEL